ncbi:MAG: hypothetical protein ACJ749_00965 [Flavisolibacter sp.]
MKRVFIVGFMAFFAACNNSGDKAKVESMSAAKDSSTTTMAEINSPYPVGDSSKFEMGNPKNAETILNLWKDWDNGNLMNSKDRFADSVTLHFANGATISTSRDSALAMAQAERNKLASSVSTVDAVTSLKSSDKGENWALIWGKEVDTDKKGKVDSSYLQETWRLNKDGKADLVYQFRAAAAPPKK